MAIVPPSDALTAALDKRAGKKPTGVGPALKAALKQINTPGMMGNQPGMVPTPTIQHRDAEGRMGPAVSRPGDDQTIGAQTGELMVPAAQTAKLAQAGLVDDVLGQSPDEMKMNMLARAIDSVIGGVLHYATGGIITAPGSATTPTTGLPVTTPPKQYDPNLMGPSAEGPAVPANPIAQQNATLTSHGIQPGAFYGMNTAQQNAILISKGIPISSITHRGGNIPDATVPPPTGGTPPASPPTPTPTPTGPPPGWPEGVPWPGSSGVTPPTFTPIPPATGELPPGVQPPSLPAPPVVGPIEIAPLPDAPDLGVADMPTLSPDEIKALYDQLGGLYTDSAQLDEIAELEKRLLAANLDELRIAAEAALGASAASLGALGGEGSAVSGDVLRLGGALYGEQIRAQAQGETEIAIRTLMAKREDAQHLFDSVLDFAMQREGNQIQWSAGERKIAADLAMQVYQTTAARNAAQAELDAAIASGNAQRIATAQANQATLDAQYNALLVNNQQWLADHNLSVEQLNQAGQQWLASFNLEQLDSQRDWALDVATFVQSHAEFVSQQDFTAGENALDRESQAELQRLRIEGEKALTQFTHDLNQPGAVATAASIASALHALGVGWDDIKNLMGNGWEAISGLVGGGDGGLGPDLVDDGTGNFVPDTGGGTPPGDQGMSNLATAGAAATGVAAAAWLINKAFEPGSGAGWDAMAGQFMGGPIGAAFGAIFGFGKDDRQVAQGAFTTAFDQAYRALNTSGALALPASDPKSIWSPQNRLGTALAFKTAFQEYAKPGVGKIDISGPDLERMDGLGVTYNVPGAQGGAAMRFLVDDPRIAALCGNGPVDDWLDIAVAGKMVPRTHEETGGSLSELIKRGEVIVRDRRTGEVINLDDPEQLRRISQQNLGGA